ncbi:hypothetical protein LPJ78_004579 [Coemansia sp. RSA 989]|nr:hypothetical protein BX667DRAFT_500124 [Coemansia mojavensis]KAJ1739895.1 hypothetical protein LPJ68_004274 [Coemansia sp. RSA 1086]KAJ1748495.1 hypothetical protein LPJ79_004486 [Coemansia sp. RSA 1821]KAJ1862661.1 hypothetical protein LPJ78_004579 [Coemansia sp. RSA 989]KAJ2668215.1 hypothetical protein IWW42_005372 [Coemansia sp. RSA 1085]
MSNSIYNIANMASFSSLFESSSAHKAVLVTSCDIYPGFKIAQELLRHKGKHYEHVYAGYFQENELVRYLKQHGAHCVKLAIANGSDAIADVYRKADVIVVVPPINDDHWGQDSCVFVSAAEKAQAKGLALCSKINAEHMGEFSMLKPLHEMEKAFHEIKSKFKAASLVRCSLHIDMLWLFRSQIASEKKICLPAKGNARFAPLTVRDGARALCHMLIDPKFPAGLYELTGHELTDFDGVAHDAASILDSEISFKEVERKEMEDYLRGKLGENNIRFMGDMLEALNKGLLDKRTDHLKDLLGKQPLSVKEYFEKNAHDFKPQL